MYHIKSHKAVYSRPLYGGGRASENLFRWDTFVTRSHSNDDIIQLLNRQIAQISCPSDLILPPCPDNPHDHCNSWSKNILCKCKAIAVARFVIALVFHVRNSHNSSHNFITAILLPPFPAKECLVKRSSRQWDRE